jgi:pyruvate formate lyase activating enzyme
MVASPAWATGVAIECRRVRVGTGIDPRRLPRARRTVENSQAPGAGRGAETMTEGHEAVLWDRGDGETVQCHLCGHECVIAGGKYGRCRVRKNAAGQLRTLNYDALVALNVDPIEKKPLYHVLPGTRSLSIAAPGCNFQCEFCQNWRISQSPRDGSAIRGQAVSPRQIVAGAANHDCPTISYTYTEPTIFFELARDTSVLAKRQGIGNCFVSNGYMTPRAVGEIARVLDAVNVDLKAFRDETYRRIMKASLDPVLACLRQLVEAGVWVEVTTLIVPEMNDSREELGDIAGFIAGELGEEVPWHISRFHGDYRMDHTPATPVETLREAYRLGQAAGLKHIYIGNVMGTEGRNTQCPSCGQAVVTREAPGRVSVDLDDGACAHCGQRVAGLWRREDLKPAPDGS